MSNEMTDMDGWMRDVADAAASLDKRGDRQMSARLMRLHRDMDIARLRGEAAQGEQQAVAWIKPDWQNPEKFDGTSPVCTYPQRGWVPLYTRPQRAAVAGDAVAYLVERIEGGGYGRGRSIIDAEKYDPTKLDFFVNEKAQANHRVTPLYALAQDRASQGAAAGVPEVGVDIPWPPLPKCWTGTAVTVEWQEGVITTREVYTGEQMRVYAQACHEAMLAAAPVAPEREVRP